MYWSVLGSRDGIRVLKLSLLTGKTGNENLVVRLFCDLNVTKSSIGFVSFWFFFFFCEVEYQESLKVYNYAMAKHMSYDSVNILSISRVKSCSLTEARHVKQLEYLQIKKYGNK
jgi:hypothetical protein